MKKIQKFHNNRANLLKFLKYKVMVNDLGHRIFLCKTLVNIITSRSKIPYELNVI